MLTLRPVRTRPNPCRRRRADHQQMPTAVLWVCTLHLVRTAYEVCGVRRPSKACAAPSFERGGNILKPAQNAQLHMTRAVSRGSRAALRYHTTEPPGTPDSPPRPLQHAEATVARFRPVTLATRLPSAQLGYQCCCLTQQLMPSSAARTPPWRSHHLAATRRSCL